MNEFTATEIWTVAGVGFGSALLGAFAGGALTYWGRRNLAERDLTRRRTGIIKAVIGELRNNVTLVSAVIAGWTGPVPISQAVWTRANFDIAQFIAEDAYRKLMVVYGGLPSMQHHCDAIQANRPDDDAFQVIQDWAETTEDIQHLLLGTRYSSGFREDWSELPNLRQVVDEAMAIHRTKTKSRGNRP